MTSSARQNNQRDPNMAVILSVIPGLGQLYNGETRKGLLFLGVTAINFIVFLLMVFMEPFLRSLWAFGISFHMKPNRELVQSLSQGHFGSPASMVIMGLFLTYFAYTARDAYDRARVIQRKQIYPEYVIELPEATSGSYIFHFSCIVACFI